MVETVSPIYSSYLKSDFYESILSHSKDQSELNEANIICSKSSALTVQVTEGQMTVIAALLIKLVPPSLKGQQTPTISSTHLSVHYRKMRQTGAGSRGTTIRLICIPRIRITDDYPIRCRGRRRRLTASQ